MAPKLTSNINIGELKISFSKFRGHHEIPGTPYLSSSKNDKLSMVSPDLAELSVDPNFNLILPVYLWIIGSF